ncbi:DUF2269 family protein [Asticcacaulis benevestitus]|uniref:Integral membrane protein n=1 Tax=Asticcacaulis benevestitus DSM 16100 = ATCC BAA-896 TaxID=1121022 RepID=V4Q0M0_9CAUL|nr:DUF2269 domain-containing protein [Asticcacaulis benevestitus]ESQ94156.1 hypothetical protein ABENE_03430 [Asticcacaulis benevestitus DSM 16100 = ATCC BAA-896]
MLYFCVKWLHILSSTVLFGTGIGTAFFMLMANLSKDIRAIAFATRTVVIADWCFTTPAIIIQPLTGFALIHIAGYHVTDGWLMLAMALYVFAGLCWLPVVGLQIRMKRLAAEALATDVPLPAAYWRCNLWWLVLGALAFPAVVAIFWLMVFKPFS